MYPYCSHVSSTIFRLGIGVGCYENAHLRLDQQRRWSPIYGALLSVIPVRAHPGREDHGRAHRFSRTEPEAVNWGAGQERRFRPIVRGIFEARASHGGRLPVHVERACPQCGDFISSLATTFDTPGPSTIHANLLNLGPNDVCKPANLSSRESPTRSKR